MADRRPLLLQALNRLYEATSPRDEAARAESDAAAPGGSLPAEPTRSAAQPRSVGHVSLVGAGPGDPRLLTRAAVARLRSADLVLYDALVDERAVAIAHRAKRFFVGKRAGRHALSQADIHAAMIRAARRGRRVVRLKGGDPFVFGRGGEEALALLNAGVPFDVVPGVTSVAAAPALAGIPVTYRGVASALLVVSGHDEESFREVVGQLGSRPITLVVLMGLARRIRLAQLLIEQAWSATTAAAIVAEASLPQQQVWRGTLADLAAGRAVVDGDGPALIVVGEVAALELTSAAARQSEDARSESLDQNPEEGIAQWLQRTT